MIDRLHNFCAAQVPKFCIIKNLRHQSRRNNIG
jgi:hypothetical protein